MTFVKKVVPSMFLRLLLRRAGRETRRAVRANHRLRSRMGALDAPSRRAHGSVYDDLCFRPIRQPSSGLAGAPGCHSRNFVRSKGGVLMGNGRIPGPLCQYRSSAVKSEAPGRVFVTDSQGQVILDITAERVKPVTPRQGFGEKRSPTQEELGLIRQLWGK
jgi:hypothetical protein